MESAQHKNTNLNKLDCLFSITSFSALIYLFNTLLFIYVYYNVNNYQKPGYLEWAICIICISMLGSSLIINSKEHFKTWPPQCIDNKSGKIKMQKSVSKQYPR